jgi:3',5'-cyclic AMP phosphodiesterase CpdA
MTALPLLLVALGTLSFQAEALMPSRGPYFVEASSRSAWVCWRVTPKSKDSCKELTNLTPGAEFEYTLSKTTMTWKARALPGLQESIRFAAIGDTGDGGALQHKVASVMTRWDPDFVIHTGDVVYPSGKDKHYDVRFFRPYEELLAKVPLFPSPGNHDYGYDWLHRPSKSRLANSYQKIFRRPKYYTFTSGHAQFFSIDNNKDGYGIKPGASIQPGSPQYRWLEKELAASKAVWKILFLHIPIYTAKDHGKHKVLQKAMEPLLTRYGVDVVFQGHNHYYERTAPIHGVTYVTTGTGGAGLYTTGGKREWSEVLLSEHGFLGITLSKTKLTIEMIDVAGKILDHHIISRD